MIVDMLASETARRDLAYLLPAISTLPPDERMKMLIISAWPFVRAGDIEEALNVMDSITPEYVCDVMPKQMAQDPFFDHVVEVIANALVEAEVHVPTYIPPTNILLNKVGVA